MFSLFFLADNSLYALMVLIPVFASIIMTMIIRLRKPKIFDMKTVSENGIQKEEMQKESNKKEGKKNLVSKENSRISSRIVEKNN